MIGFMMAFNSKLWFGVAQYHKLVFWLTERNWQYVKTMLF